MVSKVRELTMVVYVGDGKYCDWFQEIWENRIEKVSLE
jgi:hypothetical protein